MNFTVHMTLGILLVMIQTFFQLRYQYRDMAKLRSSEPQIVQDLRREIKVWQRAAASLSSYSKDEDLVRVTVLKKVNRLNKQLKKRIASGSVPEENYRATLTEMQAKVSISSKYAIFFRLIKILLYVHCIFFIVSHSKQEAVDPVHYNFGVCHNLLLPALYATYPTVVAWLDGFTGCRVVAYLVRPRGHGSGASTCRVVYVAIFCRSVYPHGIADTARPDRLDRQADGNCDLVGVRGISTGCCNFDYIMGKLS